jgi:hypothetical protein
MSALVVLLMLLAIAATAWRWSVDTRHCHGAVDDFWWPDR